MRRLVYTPEVSALIRLEEVGQVIDVSDDIISGSVTRRLNAVSNASLTLQNKFGKYTRKIQPMDRIAVYMRRYGQSFPVFTGFIDDAPFYQSIPAPVTINASCTLKLLQHTYFDPGLPTLMQFFAKHGMSYLPQTGALIDHSGRLGDSDLRGGIMKVIEASLNEIAGWPRGHIKVEPLPADFVRKMEVIWAAEGNELLESFRATKKAIERLELFLGVDLNTDGSVGSTTGAGYDFSGGNIDPVDVVRICYNQGWRGSELQTAVAIAMAESGLVTNIVNGHAPCGTWKDGKVGCRGLWQINLAAHGPEGVGSLGGILVTAQNVDDPLKCTKMAWALYKGRGGTGSGGPSTRWNDWEAYTKGSHAAHIPAAASAVTKFNSESQGRENVLVVGETAAEKAAAANKAAKTRARSKYADFLFPVATYGGFVYAPTAKQSWGDDRGDHLHAGVDIGANLGTPLLACVDGVVTNVFFQGAPGAGHAITIRQEGSTRTFNYFHLNSAPLKKEGERVYMGDVIGYVGASGTTGGWAHLHFETHPRGGYGYKSSSDPGPMLKRAWVAGDKKTVVDIGSGVVGQDSDDKGDYSASPEEIAQIGRQSAWFVMQLQGSDTFTAMQLGGRTALSNDVPFFDWLANMVTASGRVFCSKPNGDFHAFYPDYFRWFGNTSMFTVRPIEMIDLNIQVSDANLATHVFATGANFGTEMTQFDSLFPEIASVQDGAFKFFVNLGAQQRAKFTPSRFLRRFGARPFNLQLPDVKHKVLRWMAAWTKFCELWASQFVANAEITFMPEIFPGMVVSFDDKVTMFCQEVTHTFDRSGGFQTSLNCIAPGTLDPEDPRFNAMVLANGFNVQGLLDDDEKIETELRNIGARTTDDGTRRRGGA